MDCANLTIENKVYHGRMIKRQNN